MSADFPPDVVAAVCRHMDDDHRDDALLICRTLGGQPTATAVSTVHVDAEAVHFSTQVEGAEVLVRVPFAAPVTERAGLRHAVVELHRRAAAAATGEQS